jgi:superfamily II DNA helicase RecQ
MQSILDSLRGIPGKSIGRLLKEVPGDLTRKQLDTYLSALAKAELVSVEDAEWIKDGETILFRRVSLLSNGQEPEVALGVAFQLPADMTPARKSSAGGRPFTRQSSSASRSSASEKEHAPIELTAQGQQLEHALKAWRSATAKRLGMPPFIILFDRTLRAIAHAQPTTPNQLLEISGMGPAKVEKHGAEILAICRDSSLN